MRTKDESGNISCCDDASRIGAIAGARFQPDPLAGVLLAAKAALKPK